MNLYKRNITDQLECPVCLEENETVIHIVRDCHVARTSWLFQNIHATAIEQEPTTHLWLERRCTNLTVEEWTRFIVTAHTI